MLSLERAMQALNKLVAIGTASYQVFRIGRVPAVRCFAIVALLLSTPSCTRTQSVELSVDRAILTRNNAGDAAIDVFLTAESRRSYAVFTSNAVGRLLEFRFLKRTLAIVVLREPILGGVFQLSASPKGPLTESNADEIASKLSSNGEKLEVQVLDEKR